jgi:hypothetical protein
MRLLLACLLLSSCGFPDPRDPSLSPDTLAAIKLKASETAQWAPWCETWPSKDNCSDGDALAHGIGYLAAVGFKPSIAALSQSVKDGQLHRSPSRTDTDNTASRDQFLGFMAAQLSGETRWLDVKRFIKDNGRICKDATDTRCELTPVVHAMMSHVHHFLGYDRDATMLFNELVYPKTLLAQSVGVPTGYQLNLVVNASWLAYKTGNETRSTYLAAKNAYLRQPLNPWFCIVVRGPDEECATLALALWPDEPEHKNQWSIERDTSTDAIQHSVGWEFLFISALLGVDLNSLEYSGKRYSKGNLQPH